MDTNEQEWLKVVRAFAKDKQVTRQEGRGFGSGALKVKGRIFAMISSKGYLVLKLPKERVDSLVAAGEGENFDPGHGRIMKEWVVVTSDAALWVELAREARQFADGARKKKI